ncbi:hypothetical protein MmiHf6_05180 [Methanimicrococcus hongohii]|uniref:Uncharacterized protein n=1 Tax=Methanimicrococcus hongohii TaxID=3028295 RepID=A0AA97A1F1_9EURY|nr:hypothetical protein MmiHf6_05180 [Methanimicrococcus sp. Hf6]
METTDKNEIKKRNPLDTVRLKDYFEVTEIATAKPLFYLKLEKKWRDWRNKQKNKNEINKK